ncbi:hypothetical protein SCHPADRAFT_633079 [Schizopora paradoxa]|uniref:Uncharacterized protein n=1 Tax=Schizopora paradoxa TaxID=27342 RepID=A0A0H2R7I5_9AGAM|nr:hypothetical protein SCHPADRAFT_633079 [Schizopora paradoxa]
MFDIILCATIGVMILSTTIFLGFCDESHSMAPLVWSKGIPALSESHSSTSPTMLQTQPAANEQIVHQQTISNENQTRSPSDIYSPSNLSPTSSTTSMTSGPDQRTFWQKIKDIVKEMTASSWTNYGNYPGSLEARKRQARRERKQKTRVPVILFERRPHSQRTQA